jgi:hypothetical protein
MELLILDTTQYTQWQENMIQMAIVHMLYVRGITYDSILCSGNICTIQNPSQAITITSGEVLTEIEWQQSVLSLNDEGI